MDVAAIAEATDTLNLIMACPPPRTSLNGLAVDTGTHCTNPGCKSCAPAYPTRRS